MRREKPRVAVMISVISWLSILCLNYCFAQVSEEEKVTPRDVTPYSVSRPRFAKKSKFKSLLSIGQGFDNNVFLNTARKKDGFNQAFFKTAYTTPLSRKVNAVAEFNVMDLTYYESRLANLVSVALAAGLDAKLNKEISASGDYSFGVTDYVNSGKDDFKDHKLHLLLKQKLPFKLSQSIAYEFMFKDYVERKTRDSATTATTEGRQDLRNTFEYSLAKHFPDDMLKASFEFYKNDSNEKYLRYYDHDSFKVGISAIHLFSKKLFGFISFAKQFRYYDKRTITTDVTCKEKNITNVFTQAFFYNVNKSFTLGASHTYRRNDSNEPSFYLYSGSIISLSGTYNF